MEQQMCPTECNACDKKEDCKVYRISIDPDFDAESAIKELYLEVLKKFNGRDPEEILKEMKFKMQATANEVTEAMPGTLVLEFCLMMAAALLQSAVDITQALGIPSHIFNMVATKYNLTVNLYDENPGERWPDADLN